MRAVRFLRVLFVLSAALAMTGATALPSLAEPGGNSANAHFCHKDGWREVQRAEDSTRFVNTGGCVSHAAQGGAFAPIVPGVGVTYTYAGLTQGMFMWCLPNIQLTDFEPNTVYTARNYVNGSLISTSEVTTDSEGNVLYIPFSYRNFNTFEAVVNGVSSGVSPIACSAS